MRAISRERSTWPSLPPKHRLEALGWKSGFDHQEIQIIQHILERFGLAAPPGCGHGQLQILAQHSSAKAGEKWHEGRRFDQAAAQRVRNGHVACAHRFHQSGHSEVGIGAQFDGIAEAVVHAAQNYVHLLQAFESLQKNAAVANGEVAALNQRESQITREVGMLEISFVEGPGRQQHDARIVASLGRKADEIISKGTEKRREAFDLKFAEQIRKRLRHHDAIFERVARARWRLRAVGNHPPIAAGAASQIHREQVQVGVVPYIYSMTRAPKARDSQKPAPPESGRRAATFAGRKDRRELDSKVARAESDPLRSAATRMAELKVESRRDSTAGPCPADRHRRCR